MTREIIENLPPPPISSRYFDYPSALDPRLLRYVKQFAPLTRPYKGIALRVEVPFIRSSTYAAAPLPLSNLAMGNLGDV